ncbi:hypothetical protein DQ384_26110 [Sphaerisporangium album]|uniref:Uncharacterized protein n=1 Tax=Sphaerisporangium album TaxID=509200 RepID=A0A367F9Y4_9ACTN|nr:hypothetical protein [Sphaerisporangium album]RCG27196.1 hypothetical protein DQ384_26110 [Sphaerisporangium album]
MSRAAVVDGQDTLFALDGDPEPPPARPAPPAPRRGRRTARSLAHTPRRRRANQDEDCEPACLRCGGPEGRGLCQPRCAVVCAHTAQPDVIDVCIITRHVTARLAVGTPGSRPGRRLAVVDSCPWCERVHWHAAAFGVRVRVGQCGWPYVVHLDRPPVATTAALAEHTPEHQHAAERGAAAARAALTERTSCA